MQAAALASLPAIGYDLASAYCCSFFDAFQRILPILATTSRDPSTSPAGISTAKGTYSFVSLGCPKNLVDSERMLGLLQLDGYQLVQEPSGADFVVVNTCGFIERARAESFSAIEEMLKLKRQGKIRGVIVSGCLAEREKESLLETMPEIDHLVGVFGREQVTKVADRLIAGLDEQRTVFNPAPSVPLIDRGRLRITPRHFAFLKISEGCDRLCTFCAIPKMRGKHATKPIEEVVAEARELAADGVRELVIVAQDTTYYGLDLYGESRSGGTPDRAGKGRWNRVDSTNVPLSDVLWRRSDRQRLPTARRSSHISTCRCSTSMTRCSSGCSAGWIAVQRRICWRNCGRVSRILLCAQLSSPDFLDETEDQFEELVGFVDELKNLNDWACLAIRSSPIRRPPGCRIICPRTRKKPGENG